MTEMSTTDRVRSSKDSAVYSWYVVAVLMLCYALSFIDRQVLSLLVEPIKRDLDLTDTQFSLLQGFAFAIFYTFVGLFMGKLADTRNRKIIIVIGITLWSLMTAFCGLAKNFLHLFIGRVGVAVGEATLSPAAYSIIGDYFPKEKLGRAMSTYSVGVFLGSGLAFLVGGLILAVLPDINTLPLLGEVKAWQLLFIIVGLAGIPFAVLALTIREPERGRYSEDVSDADTVAEVSIVRSLRFFLQQRKFYLPHFVGFSMLTMIGYGFHSWVPAYFIRVHGWEVSQVGILYGSINVISAPLGVLAGGWFGDLLARRRPDAFIRAPVLGALVLWVPAIIATSPMVSNPYVALGLLSVLHFFASFHAGMAVAALHTVTPITMRAQATAVYLFVINLIGLGMGPLIVALITDHVFADEASVGTSLMLVGLIATPTAAALLHFASRHYSAMINSIEGDTHA